MHRRSGRSAGLLLPALLLAAAAAPAAEPARVQAARKAHGAQVEKLLREAGMPRPAELLLRAFKDESQLELWGAAQAGAPLQLVRTYAICARSGGPGPKLRAGDGQVPEGFYRISRLNPWSSYHLSLQVDYPNAADRARARAAGITSLGGDIFIHGNCVTIGCLPIEDGPIEELYLIVSDARERGAAVSVHLFPARPGSDGWKRLWQAARPPLRRFWDSLAVGDQAFQAQHRPPRMTATAEGTYRLE